ncbi:apoptosis-stimulating of p53 protein 1-like [Stegodyphus dumicola]|uniref:apoptosis-stimulating of p53 protein 1-like n=1 Tax=Stegodyphus dumicola TaxID=202533 RepID=UPI0015AFDC20|nr:apoptosis-stimulating of p53 protein 1-like [Stegodyphus dumicola]
MIPVILAVHVDNGKWVDVPITPDTKCQDVIECCREPSDEICSLVQTIGLTEHIVPEDTCMMDILSRWGHNWPAVTFHLQYSDPVENLGGFGPRPFSPTAMKENRAWRRKVLENDPHSVNVLRLADRNFVYAAYGHKGVFVGPKIYSGVK